MRPEYEFGHLDSRAKTVAADAVLLPPSPSGSFSPGGAESHKTTMSLKKFFDMLQFFDFELRPYRSNESI
jgi:hypothetical protein